jgi:hypothetical protein
MRSKIGGCCAAREMSQAEVAARPVAEARAAAPRAAARARRAVG